jgi:hypothetical protein
VTIDLDAGPLLSASSLHVTAEPPLVQRIQSVIDPRQWVIAAAFHFLVFVDEVLVEACMANDRGRPTGGR